MAQQWGAGQPGFQYPMQTGYPANTGQFQPGFGGGIAPQQTGFPAQRPPFQQPQQTGFQPLGGLQPQQTGFQPQQTGFQQGGSGFQQQIPQVPPVPPLPGNFAGSGFGQTTPNNGFLGGQQQQQPQQQQFRAPPPPPPQRSFMNPSPAFGGVGSGLAPQVTGYPGASPLVPQVTGYTDPRLNMMSSTFMPANPAMPYSGGVPQFANGPAGGQPGGSLQQSIQQYNQQSTTPKIAWVLTKAEKKNYDQIFRAWDAQGTGFISGQMALEVFGQSGLEKNDLAKIWALADADNRGKLNLAEFHVAMGLIYRRLNGVDIPDQLPPELVPPSSRDLDTSVNMLKDILKYDTSRPASANSGTSDVISRQKVRSFNDSSSAGAGGRKDATVYKHTDDSDSGGYYQSRSRHIDRRNVRVGNESPGEDLESMKRQLENTAKMLDQSTQESASRTREDEELEREMEDLRYRVKRIQEDLEYVSRGPRSTAKDEERRKLERDLLHLMHERIPEVQRKQEERERRREREKREWQRDRDRRNERFGRYDERSYDRDRDEGGYSRGTYDRDRDRDRDRDYGRDYDRDRSTERDYRRDKENGYGRDREKSYGRDDRDRDRDRPRSPPTAARSPPPAPPPAPVAEIKKPPPAPKPTASPAPNMKNMTKEEREAYIREQAQRRLQERMRVLGVTTPAPSGTEPTSPSVDTSVEDRLAREKKEAEEKARQAEKAAEERERSRRERLESEKALKDGRAVTPRPSSTAPPVAPPAPSPVAARPPPPPVHKRAPAPPPPIKRGQAPRPPVISSPAPPPPVPPVLQAAQSPSVAAPAESEDDIEEQRLREREERLRQQREARAERLRQIEREEEEARLAEEADQKRRQELLATPSRQSSAPSTPVAPPPEASAPPPPPPPPVPPAPALSSQASPIFTPSTSEKPSTNPFSKLMGQGQSAAVTPTTPSTGGTNPFFRPPQAPAAPVASSPVISPPLSRSPAPPAIKTSYHTAPQDDDDWGDANEIEENDSSDDEISSSRNARDKLAQQLFGGAVARPQSAAGSVPSQPQTPAPRSAPPAPAPPPPPPVSQGSFTAPVTPTAPVAPPPPPLAAPMAPVALAAPVAAPPGDRNALLSSIAAGARLRKTVTNDRSSAPVAGQVLGDTAPPPHINAAPRPVSPPAREAEPESVPVNQEADPRSNYRQSVDWYAGLAVDQGTRPPLPTTIEEKDEDEPVHPTVPDIHIQEAAPEESPDQLDDVDKSKEYRVRTLYTYEGQRPEDLSFAENIIITAHPSKSGGAWWYGTTVKGGKSGFFPSTYVQELENVEARALYSYSGGNSDELPFVEGDRFTIVDRSDADWWKTEKGGVIFIVPAAYLEVIEG